MSIARLRNTPLYEGSGETCSDLPEWAADRIEALEAALRRLSRIDADACDEAVNRAYGGDCTIGEAFKLILDSLNIPALISQPESTQ